MLATALTLLAGAPALAGVLPDDRADVLYHRYDGGGVRIDGPSVLVRKKFLDKFSVSANYYVDMVSSASIDVITTASPYRERRTQTSGSIDYLLGKSTYTLGYIDSSESDYQAKTAYFGVSQDLFGDLTTVSFGFKRGRNDVFRNIKDPRTGAQVRDPTFRDDVQTRTYSLGLTQVLTRELLGSFAFDVITDEGFLNSPYRTVRFLVAGLAGTPSAVVARDPERYPLTRTSNAGAVGLKYFLPYRAAVDGNYRFYTDTWGVTAHTARLGYTQPAWKHWIFDADYRYYRQTAADFYRDLFARRNELNFQARDKELAAFQSHTIGLGATFEFTVPRVPRIAKASVNFRFDRMMIRYDDFRDERASLIARTASPGGEPLYRLDANIFQLFFSAWY